MRLLIFIMLRTPKFSIEIKYEYDYKLENFNDYVDLLKKDKNTIILNHLEWIQPLVDKKFIKMKNGYDYTQEIISNDILLNDIDILSSGKITEYEGYISISKKKSTLLGGEIEKERYAKVRRKQLVRVEACRPSNHQEHQA